MADYSELKRKAQEIRNEVKAGANTANRVGLAIEELVNALEAEEQRAMEQENSLTNSIQYLQDDTEDLQSMRDTIDRLGTDKADKSALEATDKEVAKKQNKLDNYKENPSNGSVEIFSQDIVSMRNDSQGGVTSVEVYNEDNAEGIIPVARMSAEKENGDYAYVETRGNEVNIYGDYVNVNGFDLMQTIEDVATLNMRVYELGDFPTSGDAENAAKAENICKNRDISIIRYTVNDSSSHIILQDVNEDFTQQVLYYGGHTYIRHLGANLNANWKKTNPTNIKYNQDSHRIALMHMVNQYGEGDNNIDWVELPTATTTKDGLMTKAQVQSLEGKQDALQTYEETTDNAEVKMPNGNSYIRVTKDGAGMYAQDGKSGIVNSSSGSRLVYLETATDAKGDSYTSHRDDISIGRHDGNSATHITMTSRSTHEEAGAKITNTSTIQVNPEGISMSSPNGEIGDVVKEISGKASSESVSELRQEVEDKAPKVGYAPNLKVNFAKELVGRGEATPEVIGSIRPTGEISIGDGNATIERIKGRSVVWNQCMDITNVNAQHEHLLYIITKTDNIYYISKKQGGINNRDNIFVYFQHDFIPAHKYLIAYNLHRKDGENSSKQISGAGIYDGESYHSLAYMGQDYVFFSPTSSFTSTLIQISQPVTAGVALSYTIAPVIYDLTLMFGAGNEPTTIEEFEARKPLGVTNEYNEGTIVSYDGSALKSVGFNAYNGTYAKVIGGESYTAHGDITSLLFAKEMDGETTEITLDSEGKFIPADNGYVYANGSDVCIHLSHSYDPDNHPTEYMEDVHPLPDVSYILDANGNQLFLYGLLSAGSVHDEITATKAIKRVGVVDLGTLGWSLFEAQNCFQTTLYASSVGVKPATNNLLLPKYNRINNNSMGANSSDGVYCLNNTIVLFVRDTSYTTAADFKQAMSGVLLYYELAEPIEVDLPEPLNMTYEAWDFGTEELVAKSATTPLNADIVYQFNAVDRIRENSSAIDDLEENVDEVKNNQLQLSVKDNGNIVLYNSNGQSQEFMKATPSGDPMHWAYVSAGAEYNATNDFILKDAPWKDMVDTIEDKATWGLDVVDASRVKQMTIKGVEYNYATENRTSPEGGTYLRYFLVGKGSNNVWVEDETKVLHLPKCWYLNGLGDITDAEMMRIVENKFIVSVWEKSRAIQSIKARTLLRPYTLFNTDGIGAVSNLHGVNIESLILGEPNFGPLRNEFCIPTSAIISGNQKNLKYIACTRNLTSITHSNIRVLTIYNVNKSITISSPVISKESVRQNILNAVPSSAITITLHADAYARLKDDADIVAALAAKPLVTLVSA